MILDPLMHAPRYLMTFLFVMPDLSAGILAAIAARLSG